MTWIAPGSITNSYIFMCNIFGGWYLTWLILCSAQVLLLKKHRRSISDCIRTSCSNLGLRYVMARPYVLTAYDLFREIVWIWEAFWEMYDTFYVDLTSILLTAHIILWKGVYEGLKMIKCSCIKFTKNLMKLRKNGTTILSHRKKNRGLISCVTIHSNSCIKINEYGYRTA